MKLTLRLETRNDYRAVEELTREAFWGLFYPTCDEHYLVHLLRDAPAFVPELDYVAQTDGKLIGNVMYSKAKVIDSAGCEHEVLTFGPLSVLPEYWHCGVGSALMRHTIMLAKQLGYRGIVFYGHPDYYPRFGFRNAGAFQITAPDGKNFDALMAMPLYDGAFNGVSGAFYEDPVFSVNAADAKAYDRLFPRREPEAMIPIDVLLEKLKPDARKAFTDRNMTMLTGLNRVSGREILTWDGIGGQAFSIINQVLKEHGYAEKLPPSSPILRRAELGIRILEESER